MLIGELSARTAVSAKTLRFWEAEGLLPSPPRTTGGYRDFPPEVVERVRFIRAAQTAGLRLREIAEILAIRDGGQAPCRHVEEIVDRRLDEVETRLAELAAARDHLRVLARRAREVDPASCDAAVCAIIP